MIGIGITIAILVAALVMWGMRAYEHECEVDRAIRESDAKELD